MFLLTKRVQSIAFLLVILVISPLTAKIMVLSTSPTNLATDVSLARTALDITFNSNMWGPSLNTTIMTGAGKLLPLNYLSGSGTPTIKLGFPQPLECGSQYEVFLPPQATSLGGVSIYYSNFSAVAGLSLTGAASQYSNRILRLTPAVIHQGGSAWFSTRQIITNAFKISFKFRLHEQNIYAGQSGGDGFALSFHTNALSTLGASGQGLGYGNTTNLYAIEFDTFCNDPYENTTNHIAIHCAGRGAPTSSDLNRRATTTNRNLNLNDGQTHTVLIDYTPGALKVFVDNMQAPVLIDNISFKTMINLVSNRKAWVGFTAATGGAYQNHDILQWSFQYGGQTLNTNYSFKFKTPRCPLEIVHTTPSSNGVAVATNTRTISITFNQEVDASTLSGINIMGHGVTGLNYVSGNGTPTLTYSITGNLSTLSNYLVTVPATAAVFGATNLKLGAPYAFPFTFGGFYVHLNSGNDVTGDGTKSKPYATVMKALSRMDGSTVNICAIAGNNQLYQQRITNTNGSVANPIRIMRWGASNLFIHGNNSRIFYSPGGTHKVRYLTFTNLFVGNADRCFELPGTQNIRIVSSRLHHTGTGGAGLYLAYSKGITVENTVISNYQNNLYSEFPSTNISFVGSSTWNGNNGMYLVGPKNLGIRNSLFRRTTLAGDTGIYIRFGKNIGLTNIVISNYTTSGSYAESSTNISILSAKIDNPATGINFPTGSKDVILKNIRMSRPSVTGNGFLFQNVRNLAVSNVFASNFNNNFNIQSSGSNILLEQSRFVRAAINAIFVLTKKVTIKESSFRESSGVNLQFLNTATTNVRIESCSIVNSGSPSGWQTAVSLENTPKNVTIRDSNFTNAMNMINTPGGVQGSTFVRNTFWNYFNRAILMGNNSINLTIQTNNLYTTNRNTDWSVETYTGSTFIQPFSRNVIHGGRQGLFIQNNTGDLHVRNNTFFGLSTNATHIAMNLNASGGRVYVRNNIVFQAYQAFASTSAAPSNSYSLFRRTKVNYGGNAKKGIGVITNQDPYFLSTNPMDMKTTWLRLDCGSPCQDSGDPSDIVPAGGGLRIDMGAFETTNGMACSPVIVSNISPSQACPGSGEIITVRGSGFKNGFAYLNNVRIDTYTDYSNHVIRFPLPGSASSGKISVTNCCGLGGTSVSSLEIPQVIIGNVSPSYVCSGAPILISGGGFKDTQTTGKAYLGTNTMTISSWSSTQIIALAPLSGSGQVKVVNSCPSVPVPLSPIAAFASSSNSVGTAASFAIDDNNGTLWESRNTDPQWITLDLGTKLRFNMLIIDWSDAYSTRFILETSSNLISWVTCMTGTNITGKPTHWKQTNFFPTSDARYFRFRSQGRSLPAFGNHIFELDLYHIANRDISRENIRVSTRPGIQGFYPLEGCPGTLVQVTGSDFGPLQGDVLFNGYPGNIITWNESSIWVEVPNAPATGKVRVVTACGKTNLPNQIGKTTNTVTAFGASSQPGIHLTSYAFDRNLGTRWESSASDIQWIRADLGSKKIISSVVSVWETAASKSWYIQIQTNSAVDTNFSAWSTVSFMTDSRSMNPRYNTNQFSPVLARHVRIYGTSRVNAAWGHSIYEMNILSSVPTNFRVYNVQIASLTPLSGSVGTTVTINGSGFGNIQGSGKVVFHNNIQVTNCISWNDSEIIVNAPIGFQTGPIRVFNDCGDNTNSTQIFSTLGSLLEISKSISNITRGGQTAPLLPGSTIHFKIAYSNAGGSAAQSPLIYDKIPTQLVFLSNSSTTNGGWQIEWATNTTPLHSFNSTDFSTSMPSASRIKWIRWKKTTLAVGQKGKLEYKVIIR